MYAIVLGKRDFREADQVVSFYSREHGRLDLVVRGIKKSVSKQSANLQLGTLVDIDIAPGKEFDYMTTVHPIDMFQGVRIHFGKRIVLDYVLSFLYRYIKTGEPDIRIYDLLVSWLTFLSHYPCSYLHVDAFLLKFFGLQGFRPKLDVCAKTGDEDIAGFVPEYGVIAASAVQEMKSLQKNVLPCTKKEAAAMEHMLHGSWKDISDIALSQASANRVHRVVCEHVQFHAEKNIPDFQKIISSIVSFG